MMRKKSTKQLTQTIAAIAMTQAEKKAALATARFAPATADFSECFKNFLNCPDSTGRAKHLMLAKRIKE